MKTFDKRKQLQGPVQGQEVPQGEESVAQERCGVDVLLEHLQATGS
jgi:hypothetical protein